MYIFAEIKISEEKFMKSDGEERHKPKFDESVTVEKGELKIVESITNKGDKSTIIDSNMEGEVYLSNIDNFSIHQWPPGKHDDSMESDDSDSSESLESFRDWSAVMFEKSNVTVNDAIAIIQSYSLKHQISQAGKSDLFEMLKVCAGPDFDKLRVSNHKLDNLSRELDQFLKYYFYCQDCFELLLSCDRFDMSKRTVFCPNECCKKKYILTLDSQNRFISVAIRHQVYCLLNNEKLSNLLYEAITSQSYNDDISLIRDVQHGTLYKNLLKKYEHVITFSFNIDGAPIFHKSKRSMWNIQIIINELPPELRFSVILLAGILIVSREPSPKLIKLYLSTFSNQMKDLEKDITTVQSKEGHRVNIKVEVLFACLDLPARALAQNRTQYNSFFGCTYCYPESANIAGSMRYLTQDSDVVLRTN